MVDAYRIDPEDARLVTPAERAQGRAEVGGGRGGGAGEGDGGCWVWGAPRVGEGFIGCCIELGCEEGAFKGRGDVRGWVEAEEADVVWEEGGVVVRHFGGGDGKLGGFLFLMGDEEGM